VIVQVQEACPEDIKHAVAAAQKAFELNSEYRCLEPAERGVLLHKFAHLLMRDREYLAVCVVLFFYKFTFFLKSFFINLIFL
jgi:acyl-CoA reductase-like NAD-dependent aldehyde dehydrogenase